MSRMTLEEKVYQMNQFVGLEHMRQAEKDLTEEELLSNDAQGFYKGVFSDDVVEMTRREIGSFLHVLTPEESNLLQNLAAQSRLKIPLLMELMLFMKCTSFWNYRLSFTYYPSIHLGRFF